MSASVAVGIVLYKCEAHIGRCLDCLARQTRRPRQVICVDNASPDRAVEIAQGHDLRPTLLRNEGNLGFAAAHNQVVRASESDYYVALNPDLFLAPDYIERVVDLLEADPGAGWAQGKLLFEDSRGAPAPVVYSAGHAMHADYNAVNRGYGQADDGAFDEPEVIFGANGAAAVYRRRMIEHISVAGEFFDELFFLYWDDVDLDVRANAAGWHCLYVPAAQAWHVGAASGGPATDRVKVEQRKNRYLSVIKNRGVAGLARALMAAFPRNAFWFAVESAFRPDICLATLTGTLRAMGPALARRREILRRGLHAGGEGRS